MRLPAPEQESLAGDKPRGECVLSTAPIPGIEMIVQGKLLYQSTHSVPQALNFSRRYISDGLKTQTHGRTDSYLVAGTR